MQIAQRGGGLEIAVDRGHENPAVSDLMWRVRVYSVSDSEIILEQPGAAGKSVRIEVGTPIVGVMSVGQNRWMFQSRVCGPRNSRFPTRPGTLCIAQPENMERCIRREFLRVATTELRLPHVECWPLLEPSSVIPAEAANRERILNLQRPLPRMRDTFVDEILPEVGPGFAARLMNIGGGGLGLLVAKEDATTASRCRLLWARLNLTPDIPAPIGLTAKVVHTHMDSAQNLHMGAAFDFDFNPAHREFVVDQITSYATRLQHLRNAA